jgi:hypothetical protein
MDEFKSLTPPPALKISALPRSPQQAIELHQLSKAIDQAPAPELRAIAKALLHQTMIYKNAISAIARGAEL